MCVQIVRNKGDDDNGHQEKDSKCQPYFNYKLGILIQVYSVLR